MITVNSSKTLGELANWSMFLVFILIQSSLELAAIAILLEHEIPQMGLELQSHAAHIIHSVRTRTSTHTRPAPTHPPAHPPSPDCLLSGVASRSAVSPRAANLRAAQQITTKYLLCK